MASLKKSELFIYPLQDFEEYGVDVSGKKIFWLGTSSEGWTEQDAACSGWISLLDIERFDSYSWCCYVRNYWIGFKLCAVWFVYSVLEFFVCISLV